MTINITKLFPTILNSDAIPHEQAQVFSNLEPLIDGLPETKPDFIHGTSPAQVDSHILQELGHFIVPSTRDSVPVLSNFPLDSMGAEGYPFVLKRRALYNGTLGAGAIHHTNQIHAFLLGHTNFQSFSAAQRQAIYEGAERKDY